MRWSSGSRSSVSEMAVWNACCVWCGVGSVWMRSLNALAIAVVALIRCLRVYSRWPLAIWLAPVVWAFLG